MATREKKASDSKPQAASLKPQAAVKAQAGYTVLARRYRSRDFDEIVGQEPIARTLTNAIKTGRTAHAYLFCGTRGVGKTSMARIFARALNATDDLKEQQAIGDAILRGDDLDVIEIDGASYRGVQDARDLIAGAGLSPARSPYKIYIIDEVHMLTKEAFNTLLKTMEEPPAHVKFILCTTEPQKVPATIQSRCQRFDFRAIPSSKIAEQIRHILKEEGIKADDEVIAQVARLGNGSMRDALSILDRLLAGGQETLTVEHLEEMLGLPEHDLVVSAVEAFINGDASAALQAGNQLLQRSAGVEQALELLTDHLRNLMIIAASAASEGDADFLDLSDEHLKIAQRQAQAFDAPALVHMIALCDALARNARGAATARALFDAAMVRLAMSRHFADIPALLSGKVQGAGAKDDASRPAAEIEAKKKDPPLNARPAAAPEIVMARPMLLAEVNPPAVPSAVSVPERSPGSPTIASDEELWSRVLHIAAQSMGDRQRTEHLVFQGFDGVTLRLSIDDSGADIARYLSTQTDKIIDLVKRATGRSVKIDLDTSRVKRPPPTSTGSDAPLPEIVQRAADLFDATVVSIEELR